MKNLLTVILCMPVLLIAQNTLIEDNFPTKDGRIFYQDVVTIDSNLTSIMMYLCANRTALRPEQLS
jgi:hypothetical protein